MLLRFCISFHRMGYRPSGHNPYHLCFPQHTLHYSAMSSCGCSKSQTAASQGNVVRDLWMWRASLLQLALCVVHEGVGSEVVAKLCGRQKEWGCDWCGNAWRSSPPLSISVGCSLMYKHTTHQHLEHLHVRTFSFSELVTSVLPEALPEPSSTFSPKCPSIILSVAEANQMWQTKLRALFPFCPFILPSHLTSTLTFSLFIYLLVAPRQSCHVNGWHWGDYCISNLNVSRQQGAASSMTQLKPNYELANNHRSNSRAFLWRFYVN